jgi:hypothetical protein
MLNEKREQADQNTKRRCKSVILCLHQLKKKYDKIMVTTREAKAKGSEGEENENMTVAMADETDSTNTVVTTPAQKTDRNQSDAPQTSDTPPPPPWPEPPEQESKDEEKETSDIEETPPGESNSNSTPTIPGSNESLRVKEGEKKRDGETTPKPTAIAHVAPSVANTASAPPTPVIQGYFYPVLLLCIFPLVFMAGFYYLKRRK